MAERAQIMAHVLPIPYGDPLIAFAPFRDRAMSVLLHGCGQQPTARRSYVFVEPDEALQSRPGDDRDVLDAIARRATDAYVAGFFGYEFGARLDAAIPAARGGVLPDACFGIYRAIVAYDHAEARAEIVADNAERAQRLAARLGAAPLAPTQGAGGVDPLDAAARYQAQVRHVVERIRAGDLFQANLSRRFAGALGSGDHPYALFARLCMQSAAPFCAYMRLPGAAIVSNSPERLASVSSGLASTSPIKGTRPRGADAAEDAALARALADSEKDRAENLMIVDLMRNDFSRACAPGTVRTPRLFAVESYANVHHLVSTVTGRLKPGLGPTDLIRAIFPAGSITGAPKIKAMHMIDAIEQAPRDACYGAMAWFGPGGTMDSSVLIRTAICTERRQGWEVSFRVGGGIVADSEPEAEARETDVKARNLIGAIAGARA